MRDLASIRIGNVRYNSPTFQVVLLGLVVFCTVGMFSAISNLGAGGTQDIALSDTTNSILYALFAIGGLVAGAINNTLGPRLTLFLGSLGYALYAGALWCHQTTGNGWFLILSGAILGCCAALLWSAQGALMMSLPMEEDKGRAFSIFWSIFNTGSLVGASIALGITSHTKLPALSTGIYVAFVAIMLTGCALTWTVLPVHRVIRNDGSSVQLQAHPTFREELAGMFAVLKDWRILALFPMFFSSNYFYAYQGAINANRFNGRTRALVAVLQGFGAIVGAVVIGLALDMLPLRRKARGYCTLAIVLAVVLATWIGGLVFQLQFTRASVSPEWDWTDKAAIGPVILLMSYYIGDAAFQGLIYWILGCMSNDHWTLARYAGVYKAIQSAGAAGSFGMDAVATPYLNEHLASFLMTVCSLPLAYFVIRSLKETNVEIVPEESIDDVQGIPLEGVTSLDQDIKSKSEV